VIIEGLDLRGVASGQYELVCAPIKLLNGDGAPARVFLIETPAMSETPDQGRSSGRA
jgi:kynurenine formamidase